MPVLAEPLAPSRRRALRRAVLEHTQRERRRRHLCLVHVGTPGGSQVIVPVHDGETDHALRVDVLAAAFARVPGPDVLVWLSRAGPLELQDVDAAWLAAALCAAAEADRDLTMVVVTRLGWWDPRSGVRTTWLRLRQR